MVCGQLLRDIWDAIPETRNATLPKRCVCCSKQPHIVCKGHNLYLRGYDIKRWLIEWGHRQNERKIQMPDNPVPQEGSKTTEVASPRGRGRRDPNGPSPYQAQNDPRFRGAQPGPLPVSRSNSQDFQGREIVASPTRFEVASECVFVLAHP